jgi:DNA-binding LacI/PurR family transcriptional regulator
MLLGLMRAIREAGVRCPEEISVIGFDEHDWTANYSPKLTTIAQPAYEIGRLALETLLAKMSGGSEDTTRSEVRMLKASLNVRESTGPSNHAWSVARRSAIP